MKLKIQCYVSFTDKRLHTFYDDLKCTTNAMNPILIQLSHLNFFRLGFVVSFNPVRTIIASILFTLICSSGFFYFRAEKNPLKLWIPQGMFVSRCDIPKIILVTKVLHFNCENVYRFQIFTRHRLGDENISGRIPRAAGTAYSRGRIGTVCPPKS